MKVLKTIKYKQKKRLSCLRFGIPMTEEEFNEMFRLRYRVYVVEKKYGDKKIFQEKKERDVYDLEEKCKYFIATLDGRMVGTVRLVFSDPLPIRKDYFDFEEPSEIKEIPKDKIAEVSRMISRPHKFIFPRHFITLGLFDILLQFSEENDVRGGYAVIEESLKKKLEKLKIPFHSVKNFKPKKSSLTEEFSGYFDGAVKNLCIIYFLRDKLSNRVSSIMNNKLIFKKEGQKTFVFKKRAYLIINFFLKAFSK